MINKNLTVTYYQTLTEVFLPSKNLNDDYKYQKTKKWQKLYLKMLKFVILKSSKTFH